MDFLSSPAAFWAWLVELGVTEGIKYLLLVFLLAMSRTIKAWIDRLRVHLSNLAARFSRRPRREPEAPPLLTGQQRIAIRNARGWPGREVRRWKRNDAEWVRKYRFDQLWINREQSRGHACFIIMVLCFGIWVLLMGLKELVYLPEGPLISSPVKAAAAAAPMYVFELLWLRYSGRAAQLIKYRNKVRIWRWWH